MPSAFIAVMIRKAQEMKKKFLGVRSSPLKVGFVPLVDCAPLVIAQEKCFFEKRGVNVLLQKEFGWATIRDKLFMGELHAAHAAAGLSLAMTLGIGSAPLPMLTGLVLNSHGNSIVMNESLSGLLKKGGGFFKNAIESQKLKQKVTFGVVSMTSSHYFLLGKWLAQHQIDIQKDVRIVVLPAPQMAQNLSVGNIQGFCAGEPWGSVAVKEGWGCSVAVSSELSPGHPEKVLLVSQNFEDECGEEHQKIREALLEACLFCDRPENRSEVAEMISKPHYVKCDPALILKSLKGPYSMDPKNSRVISRFHCFSGEDCNAPTEKKANWLLEEFERYGFIQGMVVNRSHLLKSVFREDLYQNAVRELERNPISEKENKKTSPTQLRGGVNYQWA